MNGPMTNTNHSFGDFGFRGHIIRALTARGLRIIAERKSPKGSMFDVQAVDGSIVTKGTNAVINMSLGLVAS